MRTGAGVVTMPEHRTIVTYLPPPNWLAISSGSVTDFASRAVSLRWVAVLAWRASFAWLAGRECAGCGAAMAGVIAAARAIVAVAAVATVITAEMTRFIGLSPVGMCRTSRSPALSQRVDYRKRHESSLCFPECFTRVFSCVLCFAEGHHVADTTILFR